MADNPRDVPAADGSQPAAGEVPELIRAALRRVIVDADHSCSHEMDSLLACAVERELLAAYAAGPAQSAPAQEPGVTREELAQAVVEQAAAATLYDPLSEQGVDSVRRMVRANEKLRRLAERLEREGTK